MGAVGKHDSFKKQVYDEPHWLSRDIELLHGPDAWSVSHLFSCYWQVYNLGSGHVLVVHDFGHLFLSNFHNEPKTVHWDHCQVNIHLSICCYRCHCGGLVATNHKHEQPEVHHCSATRHMRFVTLVWMGFYLNGLLLWVTPSWIMEIRHWTYPMKIWQTMILWF